MINTIRQKIKEKLESLDLIREVNGYEKVGFKGFPAVNINFTGNESDFYSTATNARTYNYKLLVLIPLNGNPKDTQYDDQKEKVEYAMGETVDQIIQAFDEDINLKNGGEERTVDFLGAVPSRWGYIQVGEGWARTAEINIQANKRIIVRS